MPSFSQPMLPSLNESSLADNGTQSVSRLKSKTSRFHPFGKDGFTFFDLIDVINPLHHIPVIGPIYRKITGDDIGSLPRITGSTLYFGPIGASIAAANTILETVTGKDAGDHFIRILANRPMAENAHKTSYEKIVENTKAHSSQGNAWVKTEIAFRKPKLTNNKTHTEPKTKSSRSSAFEPEIPTDLLQTDPVVLWAKAETAYRAGLATRNAAVKRIEMERELRQISSAQPMPVDSFQKIKALGNSSRPINSENTSSLRVGLGSQAYSPSNLTQKES